MTKRAREIEMNVSQVEKGLTVEIGSVNSENMTADTVSARGGPDPGIVVTVETEIEGVETVQTSIETVKDPDLGTVRGPNPGRGTGQETEMTTKRSCETTPITEKRTKSIIDGDHVVEVEKGGIDRATLVICIK